MSARWLVIETTTRKGKRWHVRFESGNTEPVVHGQNLESKEAADTAILSVARAHAGDGWAHIEGGHVHVGGSVSHRASIRIVHLTEPTPPPGPRSILGELAEAVRVRRRRA